MKRNKLYLNLQISDTIFDFPRIGLFVEIAEDLSFISHLGFQVKCTSTTQCVSRAINIKPTRYVI